MPEIFAFEEEWLASGFGEGIGEAVDEVQPGWVTTFAIGREAFTGEERVLVCYRLDGKGR